MAGRRRHALPLSGRVAFAEKGRKALVEDWQVVAGQHQRRPRDQVDLAPREGLDA